MIGRIYRAALVVVIATLLLAACGGGGMIATPPSDPYPEAPAPTMPPPDDPDPRRPVFTEIDAAELLERWSILPVGVAPSRFSAARQYGACAVFTTWAGDRRYHFIDCVGEAHADNPVEGLFHMANFCEPDALVSPDQLSRYYVTVLRAGNFEPDTEDAIAVNGALPEVEVSIAEYSSNFQWASQRKWAVGNIGTRGFNTLIRGGELRFQIDHSVGVVNVGDYDHAAFYEYQRRCWSQEK